MVPLPQTLYPRTNEQIFFWKFFSNYVLILYMNFVVRTYAFGCFMVLMFTRMSLKNWKEWLEMKVLILTQLSLINLRRWGSVGSCLVVFLVGFVLVSQFPDYVGQGIKGIYPNLSGMPYAGFRPAHNNR